MKNLLCLAIVAIWACPLLAGADETGRHLAVIFPGSVQDRDYNSVGYTALQAAGQRFGLKTSDSQRVTVDGLEAAVKAHIARGAEIIWTHGGQYSGPVRRFCQRYPDCVFIIEGDEPWESYPPNLMVLGGRSYHKSYYVLGALAARLSRTGHIGYLGGMELPFAYGEINAAGQAIRAHNPELKLHYLYAGDFNDPLKGRMAAEVLIDQGCDVLLSGLNLANFGMFEAVKSAPRQVFFTTTYTSKSGYVPGHYLCSDRVNYLPPLAAALTDILENGRRSGYYPVRWGPDQARYISFPIRNVPDALNQTIRQIAQQVADGRIRVKKITDRIAFPR